MPIAHEETKKILKAFSWPTVKIIYFFTGLIGYANLWIVQSIVSHKIKKSIKNEGSLLLIHFNYIIYFISGPRQLFFTQYSTEKPKDWIIMMWMLNKIRSLSFVLLPSSFLPLTTTSWKYDLYSELNGNLIWSDLSEPLF